MSFQGFFLPPCYSLLGPDSRTRTFLRLHGPIIAALPLLRCEEDRETDRQGDAKESRDGRRDWDGGLICYRVRGNEWRKQRTSRWRTPRRPQTNLSKTTSEAWAHLHRQGASLESKKCLLSIYLRSIVWLKIILWTVNASMQPKGYWLKIPPALGN